MEYGKLPGIDKPVSRIVLGTMILNRKEMKRSFDLLDSALDVGINTFDMAHVYSGGDAERVVGAWVRDRGVQDQVVLISKGCHPNEDRKRVTEFDLASDLEDCLARMGLIQVDVYMLHRDDSERPVGPMVEAFNRHLREGKMKAYGGSNWRHERLQEANDYAATHGLIPFVASSPHFSLAEQIEDPWGAGCVAVSGPSEQEARSWYQKNAMPLFAYSSLARGLFSGKITRENYESMTDSACRKAYCHEVNFQRLDRARVLAREKDASPPQIALAFLFHQPLNLFALVGAANRQECVSAAASLDLSLTPDELDWLDLRPKRT